MATRTRGINVQTLDLTVDGMTTALAFDPSGKAYVICTEGVGWEVGSGFKVNDYDPSAPAYTVSDLVHDHTTGETVDLADFVRTFGSRLEANFGTWYRTLNG